MGGNYILLVDDNDYERYLFSKALQTLNPALIIRHAVNGFDAFQLLQETAENKPVMIFTDYNMPLMNGKEFIEKIKQDDSLKHIPVVGYSTFVKEEEAKNMLQAGAYDCMEKQLSFDALCAELNTIISLFIR